LAFLFDLRLIKGIFCRMGNAGESSKCPYVEGQYNDGNYPVSSAEPVHGSSSNNKGHIIWMMPQLSTIKKACPSRKKSRLFYNIR
jgi:hypothetical protein